MIRGQLLRGGLYRNSLLSSMAQQGLSKEHHHHRPLGKASRLNLGHTADILRMFHTSQTMTSCHDTALQRFQFEECSSRFIHHTRPREVSQHLRLRLDKTGHTSGWMSPFRPSDGRARQQLTISSCRRFAMALTCATQHGQPHAVSTDLTY